MEHCLPLPETLSALPLAVAPAIAPALPRALPTIETPDADELSDADLEHVVGGLTRVWYGAVDDRDSGLSLGS